MVESRIRIEPIDGEEAARTLTQVTKDIAAMQSRLADGLEGADGAVQVSAAQATAAASALQSLRGNLGYWFDFFDGYDPTFSWWNRRPFTKVDSTLVAYTTFLRDKIAPANKTSTLTGPALTIDPAQEGVSVHICPSVVNQMRSPAARSPAIRSAGTRPSWPTPHTSR